MGYYQVLSWLVNKRASGDNRYFSVKEISKGLEAEGNSDNGVGGILLKLEYEKYAQAQMSGDIKRWLRLYRATDVALKECR